VVKNHLLQTQANFQYASNIYLLENI